MHLVLKLFRRFRPIERQAGNAVGRLEDNVLVDYDEK